MAFVERFLEPPGMPFFLFGPRGTGKTLWTRQRFPGAVFLDMLSPNELRRYSGFPERLKELLRGEMERRQSQDFTVVIDEIQKIPELLCVVHQMIVDYPSLCFVLTGSSARRLRQGGVDLLAGRAAMCHMHPFMAAELGQEFDLERALRWGMLPVVQVARDALKSLSSFVGTYLEEEIRQEGLVRNIGDFARFLEVAALSHGTIPNYASIARDCSVSAPTVAAYFTILEDLLLSYRLPAFSFRPSRALITRTKFYLCDTGLYQNLRHQPLDDGGGYGDPSGMALEGLVGQHLRAWCDLSDGRNRLYHWRTKSGVEVDFVLADREGLWAFEVKHAKTFRQEYLKSLKIFGQDYPEAKLCLLYRGQERLRVGNVSCIPCDEFLRRLRPNRIDPS
jgi:predicted AAA+ superfamily ATPase